MKLVSWNVNGIRACLKKGLDEYIKEVNADIFCVQETKMQEGQVDINFEGYESYWDSAVKKGYSGTAIFTKIKPISVSKGMGIDIHDQEGRIVTLEFDKFYLVNVYTPNVKRGLERLDYRMQWEDDFLEYINKLTVLLENGYVDTYRYLHPDTEKFSWFSYFGNARENKVGWRIDYFIVSEELKDKVVSAGIYDDVEGSDHVPVEVIIEI